MQFSVPIFLLVLVLGILQLTLGVVFGRFLSRGKSRSVPYERRDAGRLRYLAGRLFDLTSSVAEDVGRHQSEIEHVSQELAAVHPTEDDELTEFVLKSVAQIMQINERLQDRLGAAEERLQQQTQQIEAQLNEARTDPLTGLPNRRAFDDELARRLAEWRRKSNTFCLIMIDIDHFKQLNDRHGHPAGDSVLREVADVFRSTLREMDLIARVGGEEFAAILPSTDSHDGRRATQRARSAVASHRFLVAESKLSVTVSLGLTTVENHDDAVSLMKRADEALYAAKHGGRNCGYFHDGRRCQRIKHSHEPSESSPPTIQGDSLAAADTPDDAEMEAVCGGLRERLVEVADDGHDAAMDTDERR